MNFAKFVRTPIFRSTRPEVFCKKGVLRNFAKFTGKHLCQSLFFSKNTFFTEHLRWLLMIVPSIAINILFIDIFRWLLYMSFSILMTESTFVEFFLSLRLCWKKLFLETMIYCIIFWNAECMDLTFSPFVGN